jgi:hypothetical protein
MALGTFTNNDAHGFSPTDIVGVINATIVGDGSYPTGGTASFTAYVQEKLARGVTVVSVHGIGIGGGSGYHLSYDKVNDKLKAHAGATGLEVANATDLSSVSFNATIFVK